jgi:membrane protein YdbS with pleckstrin-like domain
VAGLLLDEVESCSLRVSKSPLPSSLKEVQERGERTLITIILILVVTHGLTLAHLALSAHWSLLASGASLLCSLVVTAVLSHHALGLLEEIHVA